MTVREGGEMAFLLFATTEEAFAATKRNGVIDCIDGKCRDLEVWTVGEEAFVKSEKEKALKKEHPYQVL